MDEEPSLILKKRNIWIRELLDKNFLTVLVLI